jgi:hypothetical protein
MAAEPAEAKPAAEAAAAMNAVVHGPVGVAARVEIVAADLTVAAGQTAEESEAAIGVTVVETADVLT